MWQKLLLLQFNQRERTNKGTPRDMYIWYDDVNTCNCGISYQTT